MAKTELFAMQNFLMRKPGYVQTVVVPQLLAQGLLPISFLDPIPMSMLIMYKNVPVVTICWVTFFAICFLIFLVLSLCSESHCSCCRCLKCCREGTATVARIPSMVTTTYSSRDSLHHSLMRAGGQCDQI